MIALSIIVGIEFLAIVLLMAAVSRQRAINDSFINCLSKTTKALDIHTEKIAQTSAIQLTQSKAVIETGNLLRALINGVATIKDFCDAKSTPVAPGSDSIQ